MLLARVPVPWGSEPKAQIVYGLTKGTLWYNDSQLPIPTRDFDESDVDIDVVYKKLLVTASPRPKNLSQEIAPVLLKWAVLKGVLRRSAPPTEAKIQVMAFPRSDTTWVDQMPPSLLDWATNKGIKRSQKPEKLIPFDPFSTRTKVSSINEDSQEWVDQLPPSLLAWAVNRGIKKSSPPSRPHLEVHSIEKRQQVFELLQRGEWCFVYDLDDFLPLHLRQWLIQCKVKFIRYVGGGRVSGTPVNGYVTEDGTVFYVAEDGSTFYVQET